MRKESPLQKKEKKSLDTKQKTIGLGVERYELR